MGRSLLRGITVFNASTKPGKVGAGSKDLKQPRARNLKQFRPLEQTIVSKKIMKRFPHVKGKGGGKFHCDIDGLIVMPLPEHLQKWVTFLYDSVRDKRFRASNN